MGHGVEGRRDLRASSDKGTEAGSQVTWVLISAVTSDLWELSQIQYALRATVS